MRTIPLRTLVMPLIITILTANHAAGLETAERPVLPRKAARQVKEHVIPALKAENNDAFLTATVPLFSSLTKEQLEQIDSLCREQNLAPAQGTFEDLTIGHAMDRAMPQPILTNANLSHIMLQGLLRHVDEFIEKTPEHKVMQDPLVVPPTFVESEKLFWDIHVLHNQFSNTQKKLQMAQSLLARHHKRWRKDDEGKRLSKRINDLNTRLTQNYLDISERSADLRLQRFQSSFAVLNEESNHDDFDKMLTSTMSLQLDGSLLLQFLSQQDPEAISRPSLNKGLQEEIASHLDSGQKAAGEIATKAHLLRNGLHYWVRGRYGAGPLVQGLVKVPAALKSENAMAALYMPIVRDKPISKYHDENESISGFERRHYYTWAAEYRPIVGARNQHVSEQSRLYKGPSTEERFL